MSKRIKKWVIPGSNGKEWTVAVDKDGNYGCSCPVWKFKRKECHHIEQAKESAMMTHGAALSNRDARAGNVGEVTIIGDLVLYPLVPFSGNAVNLIATIIYDMQRAGVSLEQVKDYKDRMLKGKVSFKAIREHVESRGRYIYTRFQKGSGWTSPAFVTHDTPIKIITEKHDRKES